MGYLAIFESKFFGVLDGYGASCLATLELVSFGASSLATLAISEQLLWRS